MTQGGKPLTPQEAVKLHQSGDIAGAAQAYRVILGKDRRNPQILNLLGVATLQLGQARPAVDLLREAVRLQPGAPDFQDNLGSALRAAGQVEEAVAAHRQAIEEYRRAVAIRPQHVGTLFNLANSLRSVGDLDEATGTFRAVLSQDPGHAQAWNNLGSLLSHLGELDQAELAYRQALALRPAHAETLSNLGNVLVTRGRLGEGMKVHRAAVAADPTNADGHIFLGVAYQELDALNEAIAAYREGLRLDPDNVRGLVNLGAALQLVGRIIEAEALLTRALRLSPGFAEAWGNLGLCRLAVGDRERAKAALERALGLDGDLPRARMTRALLGLADGELSVGWEDYAWRFAAGEALPDRRFEVPTWDGAALPDGHLMIWREQGLGDELMFATLYRDAIARAGRVTLQCDPRLVSLFTRSFPQAHVEAAPAAQLASEKPEAIGADRQIPAGSLMALLRPELQDFDGAPYLRPDKRRVETAQAWLDGLPAGLRVGFCWRSSMITHRRRHNYWPLQQWSPLVGLSGIVPVSLQYGVDAAEIDELAAAAGRPLHVMPGLDLTNDLEGVAALLHSLDLVVAAPTAIGEMAGALGVPVWRVVASEDWSMLGTGSRPWFRSMRTFAAPTGRHGDMAAVYRALRAALTAVGPMDHTCPE